MPPDAVLLVDAELLHDEQLRVRSALGRVDFDNQSFHFSLLSRADRSRTGTTPGPQPGGLPSSPRPGGVGEIRTRNLLDLGQTTLPNWSTTPVVARVGSDPTPSAL